MVCTQVYKAFLDYQLVLMWACSAHYGRCNHCTDGPAIAKAGWASYEGQARKQCFSMASASGPASWFLLEFLPLLPSGKDCALRAVSWNETFLLKVSFAHFHYHDNRKQIRTISELIHNLQTCSCILIFILKNGIKGIGPRFLCILLG